MTSFHGRIRNYCTAFYPASLPNNPSHTLLSPSQSFTSNGYSWTCSLSLMLQKSSVVLTLLTSLIIFLFVLMTSNFIFSTSSSFLSFYYSCQHNVLINKTSKYYVFYPFKRMDKAITKFIIWYAPPCHFLF